MPKQQQQQEAASLKTGHVNFYYQKDISLIFYHHLDDTWIINLTTFYITHPNITYWPTSQWTDFAVDYLIFKVLYPNKRMVLLKTLRGNSMLDFDAQTLKLRLLQSFVVAVVIVKLIAMVNINLTLERNNNNYCKIDHMPSITLDYNS